MIFCERHHNSIPFAKFYSLESQLSLSDWVENLAAGGRHSFSLYEARKAFASDTETALKQKLRRLSRKGKIISIHKGYYLLITSQYASRGILPPPLFINDLMKYLERPYYIGLLSAAGFHGAAHQQPQEYFVFTDFPVLRPMNKKKIRIHYISKRDFAENSLEKKKTETGFINISNPALTALDLVQFDKHIGGLNRAATVLNELAESIKPEQINENLLLKVPLSAIQRTGFLLDVILKKDIGKHLYEVCQKANLEFFRIPLRTSALKNGASSDQRWKVIRNTEIEIDE